MLDWTSIIVAVVTVIPTFGAALMGWRATHGVHKIVNSQRQEMISEIKSLHDKINSLEREIAIRQVILEHPSLRAVQKTKKSKKR